MNENKNTIWARISELNEIIKTDSLPQSLKYQLEERREHLYKSLETAQDTIMNSVIRSHKAVCAAKNMDEKAAYGNDPAIYYSLAIVGEAGELANKIVKSLRNGFDRSRILEAVKSELPDVLIYSYVLAYVLDIDLTSLVNEKVEIVIKRAETGYYGGHLHIQSTGSPK